ncbi:hypothetical protein [Catellatospora tritici]|uniref:hypothetical protein n=1 Tax=Catellatospora tritici TaxID=2851566 RepID=UPI001C2CD717|nr:hypothetical protein [Catellatospora tritici]MBV1849438.1 hypothetical protein [Catellatospora tritici]MBV1854010.1 hypothetical protein [Catellatospora tritici]
MTDETARSGWQNGVLAATSLLAAVIGAWVLLTLVAPQSKLLAVMAALLWAAAMTVLAVRAVRLGVYTEQSVLVVRGMARTWRIPAADVARVPVVEQSNGRGGRYFAPVIMYYVTAEPRPVASRATPSGERPTAGVLVPWQSAPTEQDARRYAERIEALVARARAATGESTAQ